MTTSYNNHFSDREGMHEIPQEEFKQMAECSPNIIWVWNAEGKVLYINKRWFEYSQSDAGDDSRERRWKQVLHPDDYFKVKSLVNEGIETGKIIETEFRIKRGSDVSFRWHLVRVLPFRDEKGRILKWHGTATDIEEWKAASEKRERSEALLKEAQETAHLGNWELIFHDNKVSMSDEMFSIFGIKREEFDGTLQHILTFIHPEDQEKILDFLDSIKTGHKPAHISCRIIRPDSKIRFLSVSVKFIYDREHHLIAIRGTAQDITEIEERERLMQHISDASPCIIVVYDLQLKKCIYINKDIFFQLGYSQEELWEKDISIFDLIHPEDQDSHAEARNNWSGFTNDDAKELEYRVKNARGEWLWYSTRLKVFKRDVNGNVIQIISVVQDVTFRKKNEKEAVDLKLFQQKEILNAVLHAQEGERERIGETLHNGLGQLLYAVKLNFEKYKLRAGDSGHDDINPLINEAIDQARRISFELMPGILKDFGLEVALKEFTRKIDKNFNFIWSISGMKERLNDYMEMAIFRIIQELLNNVIKYAQVKEAKITFAKHGSVINITVEDKGVGFEVKKINKRHEGTGLQRIKNRVDLLNGKFNVSSHPGKGTMAHIELDLKKTWDLK